MNFTPRETATLLHALRLHQETMTPYKEPCTVGSCEHFLEVESLTTEEIDGLCERLNAAVGPTMYETLQTIADFAVGNGDVCEIIARRARAAIRKADGQ